MIGVTENLRKIRDLLDQTAIQAGRDPGSVRLLAVSKKQPVEKIEEAFAAGQRDFGENLVQEGLDKIASTTADGLIWHFIGHLQTNKTRAVAEHFDWVHSIDRAKIAERLNRQRPIEKGPLNVCLQVNIDDEASKFGVAPGGLNELVDAVSGLDRLRLRGLMCLPAIREDFEEQRQAFRKLRLMAESVTAGGHSLDTLSMGMSGDFQAAIHEGSTMVRIGTAIFGPRS